MYGKNAAKLCAVEKEYTTPEGMIPTFFFSKHSKLILGNPFDLEGIAVKPPHYAEFHPGVSPDLWRRRGGVGGGVVHFLHDQFLYTILHKKSNQLWRGLSFRVLLYLQKDA